MGSDQGHDPHQPRPGRLRPVFLGRAAQLLHRNERAIDTFVTMQFTSDFQEKDIVFGGDKKLAKIIDEIQDLFPLNPGITIQSECPIGLIGDDIEAVSKVKSKEYGGKTIVPVRCEGFRGVSQSLGHHIANDAVRDWIFDKVSPEAKPAYRNPRPMTSRSSATTTSAATRGPRAFLLERWACA